MYELTKIKKLLQTRSKEPSCGTQEHSYCGSLGLRGLFRLLVRRGRKN